MRLITRHSTVSSIAKKEPCLQSVGKLIPTIDDPFVIRERKGLLFSVLGHMSAEKIPPFPDLGA